MKATPEQQLYILAHNLLPLLTAIVKGYVYDPDTTPNLYDEQPIYVRMELGDYRKAVRLATELVRMEEERLDTGGMTEAQKSAAARAIFDNDYRGINDLKAIGQWPPSKSKG